MGIGQWEYESSQQYSSHNAARLETAPDGVPAEAASTDATQPATSDDVTRGSSGNAPVPATPEGLAATENEDDDTENSNNEQPKNEGDDTENSNKEQPENEDDDTENSNNEQPENEDDDTEKSNNEQSENEDDDTENSNNEQPELTVQPATCDDVTRGAGVNAPTFTASEAVTVHDSEEEDSDVDIENYHDDQPELLPVKGLPRKSQVVINTNTTVINGATHIVQVFEEAEDFEESEICDVARNESLLESLHGRHGTWANILAADKANSKRSSAVGGQDKRELAHDGGGVKASSSGRERSDKRHKKCETKQAHGQSSFKHSSCSIHKEKSQHSVSSSKAQGPKCCTASSRTSPEHSVSRTSRDRSPICKKTSTERIGSKPSSRHAKSHHDTSRASSCHGSCKVKSHRRSHKSRCGSFKAKTHHNPDRSSRSSGHHNSSSRASSTQSAKLKYDSAKNTCKEKSKKSRRASSKTSSHHEVARSSWAHSSGISSSSHESSATCRSNSRSHGRDTRHRLSLQKQIKQHKEHIVASPQKKKLKLQRDESAWSAKARGGGKSSEKYVALSLATVEKAKTVKARHRDQLETLCTSRISCKTASRMTEKRGKKVARSATVLMPVVPGTSSMKDCTVSLSRPSLMQKHVKPHSELPGKWYKNSRSSLKAKPATKSGEHEAQPGHREKNKPPHDPSQMSKVRNETTAAASPAGLSAVLQHSTSPSATERTSLPHGSSAPASSTPSSASDPNTSTASIPELESELEAPVFALPQSTNPPALESYAPVSPQTNPHPSGPLPATDPCHSSPPPAASRQGVIRKQTVREKLQAFRYRGAVQHPDPEPVHNQPSQATPQSAQFQQMTTLDHGLTRRATKRPVTPEPREAKKQKTPGKLQGVGNSPKDVGSDASSRADPLRSGKSSLQARSGHPPLPVSASASLSSSAPSFAVASSPSLDDVSTAALWMELEARGRYKACSCGMVSCNFALFFLHQSFHSHDGRFRCIECGKECITKVNYLSHLMEMHAKCGST